MDSAPGKHRSTAPDWIAAVVFSCIHFRQGKGIPSITMWQKEAQFTAMVNALSGDLYRYAFWLCRHREQAEDLVQETFARAWRSLEDLRDDRAARAWLLVTLRREHARLYERIRPPTTDIDPDTVPASRRDFDGSTEAWVLRRELARLPREYSEPLVLQVIGGYSGEEIADMLNLTAAAVTTRLFRARQQLRRALGDDPELGVASV